MTERITQARLERVRSALEAVAITDDEGARRELRRKLDEMRERLSAPICSTTENFAADSVTFDAHATRAEAMVSLAKDRLQEVLDDNDTPEHVLEAALRQLRVARLHALVADMENENARL